RYTLCVLARFIGFRDYEDFIDNLHSVDVQSASYIGATVDSASLDEGIEVRVTWSPGRSCRLRHLRGNEFEVVESHNGKLAVGDIVECGSFTMNAPLYFNRVRRPDGQQLTYVAGSRSGISFEII
ncbi:MAG: hypothetical protein K2G01_07225, partial [Paramuribaculum sp.]|nr:hypothetical protein [Paramuribaculum sp.]